MSGGEGVGAASLVATPVWPGIDAQDGILGQRTFADYVAQAFADSLRRRKWVHDLQALRPHRVVEILRVEPRHSGLNARGDY